MNQRLFLSCTCFLILVSLVAVPVLAATVLCPSSCSCLLPADAKKMGYPGYCQGKQAVCGYDLQKNEKYCYSKPVTTTPVPVTCPSGCSCYTLEDGKEQGVGLCNNTMTLCGYSKTQQKMYCHKSPVTVTTTTPVPVSCPSGCSCYTLEDGKQKGIGLCNNQMTLCGYSQTQQKMYCHKSPVTVTTTTPSRLHARPHARASRSRTASRRGTSSAAESRPSAGTAEPAAHVLPQKPVTVITVPVVNITRGERIACSPGARSSRAGG